jgi:hypothetical protein
VLTMTIKYFAFSTFFPLVMIDIGIPHTKLNYVIPHAIKLWNTLT